MRAYRRPSIRRVSTTQILYAPPVEYLAVFGLAGTAVEVVPEPASIAIWSLIGLGLAGFGYSRTRRKK